LIRSADSVGEIFWSAFDELLDSLKNRTYAGRRIMPRHFNEPGKRFLEAIHGNPYIVDTSWTPIDRSGKGGRLMLRGLFKGRLDAPDRTPEELYVIREIEVTAEARRWSYTNRPLPVSVSWHMMRRYLERGEGVADGMFDEMRSDLAAAIRLAGAWLYATRDKKAEALTFASRTANGGAIIGKRLLCSGRELDGFTTYGNKDGVFQEPLTADPQVTTVSFRTFVGQSQLHDIQIEALDLLSQWIDRFMPDYSRLAKNFPSPADPLPSELYVPLHALAIITTDGRWKDAFRGRFCAGQEGAATGAIARIVA
jgi:hypothetical protein